MIRGEEAMQNPVITQELARHECLRGQVQREFPDVDEETLNDTLAGMTDLPEMIAAVLRLALEDLAQLLLMRSESGRLLLDGDLVPGEDIGILRRFLEDRPGWSLHVVGENPWPVIGYPKAWSPPIEGRVEAEVVTLSGRTREEIEALDLTGKIVLIESPRELSEHFEGDARRHDPESLLQLADGTRSTTRRNTCRRKSSKGGALGTPSIGSGRIWRARTWPRAMSWPPASRAAVMNGMAHAFSKTSRAATAPGFIASAASLASSSPSNPDRAPAKALKPPTWSAVRSLSSPPETVPSSSLRMTSRS